MGEHAAPQVVDADVVQPGDRHHGRRPLPLAVHEHRDHLGEAGIADKRAQQQLEFTWALVRDELDQRLRDSTGVRRIRDQVREDVLSGELPAPVAADRLLAAYDEDRGP